MRKTIRKILCVCLGIILFAQTSFAANLYKDETFKNAWKRLKFKTTYEHSDGVLYNDEQLRVEMNDNRYMKCKLTISEIKPHTRNMITVFVNEIQVISYDNFEQITQPFYAYVDPSLRGDFHVRFYSIDTITGKPNKDVYVTLSDVVTLQYVPNDLMNNASF